MIRDIIIGYGVVGLSLFRWSYRWLLLGGTVVDSWGEICFGLFSSMFMIVTWGIWIIPGLINRHGNPESVHKFITGDPRSRTEKKADKLNASKKRANELEARNKELERLLNLT